MDTAIVQLVSVVMATAAQGVTQATGYGGAGWFTLALVNAGIAQGKNRSGMNWFLLSLPFGPVATFVLVLFSKLAPKE
jgi:hypothetical protein